MIIEKYELETINTLKKGDRINLLSCTFCNEVNENLLHLRFHKLETSVHVYICKNCILRGVVKKHD